MNKPEAKALLTKQLSEWRLLPYDDLASRIGGESITGEVHGESDQIYQFEIQVFWDDKPNGDIRVIGAIDDAGFRAFFSPLTDDFIMAQDGSFVDEDPHQQDIQAK